ncbi:HepT-like ribonuclease domain-containing protein [Uliginosibacterium sp. H1]|uniref:HepT-like ribonuclease domain-containing protein n=1 Tax=Uliginosibacterium sp. H1 TaxID=3114757 RepID=UPI002E18E30F|nr:DUF86 domain-containing protein [Uliginosibacterium sp. H1]
MERIQRYIGDMDEAGFLCDEKTQDAVVRNFEVIGEAARNIERHHPAFAAEHDDIPWSLLHTMRNRVAHGYFKVDFGLVWRTIEVDLPVLQGQIQRLLASL